MSEAEYADVEKEGMGRWKKVLIGLAIVFVGVGFALKATAGDAPAATQQGMSGTSSTGLGGNTLVGGGGLPGTGGEVPTADAQSDSLSSYSPFFVKGGFSFLLMFAVGMALRMFFKISMLMVGFFALGLFGLQKIGWVDPDWQAMSQWWDKISGKVMEHGEGLKGFLTGNLPSAGLGGLGLFTGFKKG